MKYLFLCIFFSCVAMQDPLSHFGGGPARELSINYNSGETVVFIKDIHIKNNSVYVFFVTENLSGIMRRYDMAGNVLQEVVMRAGDNPVYFENKLQILWESDYFYLPAWYSSLDGISGAVQKYNYQLELQENFGVQGTMSFKDIDYNCGFASVGSVGGKYFAGGYNQNQSNEGVISSYILVDFDPINGHLNHYYQEDQRVVGGTRSVNFMNLYYKDSKYYLLGITFENELIYQELNQENDLLFQKPSDIRVD